MKYNFDKLDYAYEKGALKKGYAEFWGKGISVVSSSTELDGEEYKEEWDTDLLWGIAIKPSISKTQAKKEFGRICKSYNFKPSDFFKISKERLYLDEWEGYWVRDQIGDDEPMCDCWFFEPKIDIRY